MPHQHNLSYGTSTEQEWNTFIQSQPYTPFLQSYRMADVYLKTKQESEYFSIYAHGVLVGVCLVVYINAKRGKHCTIPYGPIIDSLQPPDRQVQIFNEFMHEIKRYALSKKALFIRISPHWPMNSAIAPILDSYIQSPMHLLAENIWYLPLTNKNRWQPGQVSIQNDHKTEIFNALRKTTRNLIRRAEKDGVTITKSSNPTVDIEHFIRLHDETRKRHHFTPYTNEFFRSQVEIFSKSQECTLYLAWYEGKCICASIHMHFGGETSYHHGASASEYSKVPASYLLQWHAICDAIDRGDSIYNFWGIAPVEFKEDKWQITNNIKKHPFAGVTLFKTGFGGTLLSLVPCHDIPLSKLYTITRWFEIFRKWKRGF